MSRAPRLLLAGAASTLALALPAQTLAAPPASAPPAATAPSTPAQPTPGVQVGPPPPPSSPSTGAGTVGGDQASHPHFQGSRRAEGHALWPGSLIHSKEDR